MNQRIHCNICGKAFKDGSTVFLDEYNTVTHQSCYSLDTNMNIKDLGTYRSILEQYSFFHELMDERT